MNKTTRKGVRMSENDLEYADKLIEKIPEAEDFSTLIRFLLYDYKEKEEIESIESTLKKLIKEQELTRETFNIYLEYLSNVGEGIDSEALHKEAVRRIEKRNKKTRNEYFSKRTFRKN